MSKSMSVAAVAVIAAAVMLSTVTAQTNSNPSLVRTFQNVMAAGRPANVRVFPTVQGNRFVGQILNSVYENSTFPAGQELRMVVATAYLVNRTTSDKNGLSVIQLPRSLSQMLAANFSFLPAFNSSGPSPVRVRVIAAHSTRTATFGASIRCAAGSSHDVWAEFWGMAPRNLAFGRQMVFSGFVTFTAPPFNFRVCVKDVSRRNNTKAGAVTDSSLNNGWMELENYNRGQFHRFREPAFMWRAPPLATTHYAGDYASFEILGNNPPGRGILPGTPLRVNVSAFSLSDSVKLVPYGFPCTYEKKTEKLQKVASASSSASALLQYCGSNLVAADGEWLVAQCEREGSVAGGVAKVGGKEINLFASLTANVPSGETSKWTTKAATRTNLVAYLQLPAAGGYDVCVSTKTFRRTAWITSAMRWGTVDGWSARAQSVWFKAYDASASSGCAQLTTYKTTKYVAGCQPRSTQLTVTAAATTVSWSTVDDTQSSWGEIAFTAATGTTLTYTAATQWDHSSTRDYFNLTGGDMFRLVPEARFTAASAVTAGDMSRNVEIHSASALRSTTTSTVAAASVSTTTGSLTTTGAGTYKQYYFGQPNFGTQLATDGTASGCFWQGDDNYGASSLNGNPSTQCCTISGSACTSSNWCTMSDTGDLLGVRSSADLGGSPRTSYSPWLLDGTGSNAWAYIRFPPGGKFRVCYRTAQGHWRVLPGTSTLHSASNTTFAPKALTSGYTYHFNDTRAGTWGPVQIKSVSGARIDTLAWSYYTTTTSPVVGSALKIVKTTESCYTATAQSKTYSINSGLMEDGVGLGSATDSATLQTSVYFYVKVPAQDGSTKYRICFRRANENWQALSDPHFVAHLYMSTSNQFGPRFAPMLTFTLTDNSAGSWGKFIVNRTSVGSSFVATQSFNVDSRSGDMIRLVPNRTATGMEVFCDVVVGTTTDAVKLQQVSSAATQTSNLGQVCAGSTSTTTDYCYSSTLQPTDNSISATTPYTNLNVGSDNPRVGLMDAVVGFITVPTGLLSSRPVGYKVCYKMARFANWIEASGSNFNGVLTVKAGRTVTAAAPSTTVLAGSYTYVALTATAANPITPANDLVKLVPSTSTCEAPVVLDGGYDKYSAISGVSSTNALVDGSNSTIIINGYGAAGTTTTARAYMIMPTPAAGVNPGNLHTTSYRVCYMARTSSTSELFNWWDLGTMNVVNVGIVYTVTNKPMVYGALAIRFFSGYQQLDTRPSKDAAKIIPYYRPCIDTTGTTVQPSGASSNANHVGIEVGTSTSGITDVGPTDMFPAREARITTVLDASSTGYKVCYRPSGSAWIEVREALGSQRVYLQSTTDSTIRPTTSEVSKYTLAAGLTGQYSNQPTYAGVSGVAWTTVAVGGASTYDGSSNYFSVTYSATQSAGNKFILKFVRSHIEFPEGTWTFVAGSDCFGTGISHTYTSTASTSDNIAFNLPTMHGKYIVCLWSPLTSVWYQLPADSVTATTGQPMTVVSNKMAFVPTTTGFQINDYHAQNQSSFAGLAGGDFVYIVNATGGASACGSVGDWRSVARDTAKVNLSSTAFGSDTTTFIAQRLATITLPAAPRTGAYAVCVYRSQAAASNYSGFTPFVKVGWYQVWNDGAATTGGGSDTYVVSAATKLNFTSCPTNSSTKVRGGSTFDIEVIAQDASSNLVTYTAGVARYGVTATAVTSFALQTANGECTATNAPSYGYTSAALTQYMTNGRVKFSLTSLSACPGGVCTYSFASTDGLTTSPQCSFTVPQTSIASLSFSTAPTSCSVWMASGCTFRLVALHSDGGISTTASQGVSLVMSGNSGLSSQLLSTTTGATVGAAFTNGVFDFNVRFAPSAYSALTTQSVTLTATANGVTATVTVTVNRPSLAAVNIVDIFPVAVTGSPIMPMVPSWEPSTTTFRYDDVSRPTAALTAGSGYHLVAGQFYNIMLKASVTLAATINGVATTLTVFARDGAVVPSPFAVTVDPTFVTALTTAGNAIHDGTQCSTESCTAAFSSYAMGGSSSGTVTVRLQNSLGCSPTCTIPLKFNGADVVTGTVTSITTPVRSVATTLQIRCATSLAGLATASVGSCDNVASTVNRGWFLNVSAVDARGAVDTFFNGNVIATLSGTPMAMLTTVSALTANQASTGFVSVTAVNGWALFDSLTVSKPCPVRGCMLELLSTWGTNVVNGGSLVATPNTVRLSAVLNKALLFCDSTSTTTCNSVAGVSLANTTHVRSLIYKDTQVCATVMAVDSNGQPTLYETNWVMYYARDVTGDGTTQALTLTDDKANTGFTQRYRAMVNSVVSFCFTISGFTSSRSVTINFGAQRFGGSTYWAFGSTGTAALGPMKVWPTKLIGRVLLSGATNGDVVTGGVAGVVSAAKATTTNLQLGFTFLLKDHYNVTLTTADLATSELSKYLYPRLSATDGTVIVNAIGSKQLRGFTNATIVTGQSAFNTTAAALVATFSFDGYCLGCTLYFDLLNQAGAVVGAVTTTAGGAVEYLGSNVTVYIVNTISTSTRVLAFNPSTSPMTSYWVNGSTTANLLLSTNSAPTMHVTSCVGSTCAPFPGAYNLGKCDARGTGRAMLASAASGLTMRVFTVGAGSAATSAFEPASDNLWQVDVLNTYTVSISFGNQLLACQTSGSACQSDNTAAPSQTLTAYGATVRDAIGKFAGVADASIVQTNFWTIGLTTSSYLAINATTSKYTSAPSVGGAFAASAASTSFTGSVSGISSAAGHAFYWRPAAEPRGLVVASSALNVDPCNETATYSCSGGTGCTTTGLAQSGLIEGGLNFAYAAQAIPVGVSFPITMEVRDVNGMRVVGASGTVAITTDSWSGCNNGGAPTFSGVVANGRMTTFVTFASACQACVLKFVFTPAASQSSSFATMLANPSSLMAYSSAINVVSTTQVASQVVVTAATPAAALVSGTTSLTIATPVQLTLTPRALVGNLPFAAAAAADSMVNVYPTVVTGTTLLTLGNGGVLRAAVGTNIMNHGALSFSGVSGAFTATALFSRTCSACRLTVGYLLGGPLSGVAGTTFNLPATFVITTAASQQTLMGYVPRKTKVGAAIAVALWATGSEDSAIAIAGLAPVSTVSSAASPSSSATVSTNGNGGTLTSRSWVFNNTQIQRIHWSGPCSTCTVTVAGNSFPVRVSTVATALLPAITLSAADATMGLARPAQVVAVNQWLATSVTALDDNGFTDESFGIVGCQWPEDRFQCTSNTAFVGISLTSDGVSASFPVSQSGFLMADASGIAQSSGFVSQGVGLVNFSFTMPQRNVVPVYTAVLGTQQVSSRLTGPGALFPAPKYSVAVGLSGLSLAVVATQSVALLTANVPVVFNVALVGTAANAASKSYVAVGANNAITVSFSAACPAANVTTSNSSLMDGYTNFMVSFLSSDNSGNCAITFTAGAGTGRCTTTAACTSTVSNVLVAALSASRFNILRPTVFDNGVGSSAQPMYAHAGRAMALRAQVVGLGADGKTEIPVTNCATCQLVVASTDCNFATAPSAVKFSTNDQAEMSLTFPDTGAATYTCSISVSVLGATATALVGPDRSSTTFKYLITVCKSAAVKLLTNTTSQYRGMLLQTGVAYEFYAIMTTAAGAQCWGDSGDSATVLTISAVDGLTGKAIPTLSAVNVNWTSTTNDGFANGMTTAAARMNATAVGGGFRFQVVFTNSSVRLGLKGGVKLQVSAALSTPSVAVSGRVDTIVAAAQLRFSPSTQLPPMAVKSRALYTGPGFQTAVSVAAVDALPGQWQSLGLMSGQPNIASGASDFGSTASVFWRVAPSVPGTQLPLTFGAGSASTTSLSSGTASWSSVAWSGPDGTYAWSVQSATAGIAATPAMNVFAQAAVSLKLVTAGFTQKAEALCSSSCVLPNSTFVSKTNATINGGQPFLSVGVLQNFMLTVSIVDASGVAPVLGDRESIVAVSLNANAGSSVMLMGAPAYVSSGVQYARVRNGMANFSLGFLGATVLSTGVEALASLTFSCPATKPASMLEAGEPSANPCASLASVTTQTFQVADPRLSSAFLRSSAVVRAAISVFALSLSAKNLAAVNLTQFKQDLLPGFSALPYVTPTNVNGVVVSVRCLTDSTFTGGLGSTVCGGTPQTCSWKAGNLNCPSGVVTCDCPGSARTSVLLRRTLLQNSSAFNGSATALEFVLDLTQAAGLPAFTEAGVAAEYTRAQASVLNLLSNSSFSNKYGITGVTTRSSTVVVTARPTTAAPTNAPPVVVPNPPPVVSPTTEAPVNSASSVVVALSMVLALVLALFA